MYEFCCLQQNEGYVIRVVSRSSYKERKGNALASGAEEGRDKLRKASGRSKYPLIRGFPNGATRLDNIQSSCVEQNRRTKGTA